MTVADARCVYKTLDARLRPFVARRVSSSDVDDVMQDVFVRVHRGLHGLRDSERLGAWVFQIARSAIADHLRSRARVLPTGELPEESAAPAHEDDDQAFQEIAACAVPFVAALPSPYREALTLTELEGLTQQQAAELVGISLSGMKSRVQRGRERLRALFEECCAIALDGRGHVMDCAPREVPCHSTPIGVGGIDKRRCV
jgi:RNA polymerase sigma-70 factor (ECF subfamily)